MGSIDLTESLAKGVEELPTLPLVATRLLSMLGDDDSSLRDVAKIVQNDAALTSRVLRVANSAAFSRGKPITSLFRAVMHLGMKIVAGITIGSCATSLMNKPLEGYGSEVGELWDHSLRTATGAREFAFFCIQAVAEDLAFTAGLLHDIGKSIISDHLIGSSEKLVELTSDVAVVDYIQVEREILGTDHAAVGFAIAERWGLPEPLRYAIRDHHHPMDSPPEHRSLSYTVHLGDLIAQMGGSGTGADTLAYKIDENYQDYLQVDQTDLSRLLMNVQTEFNISRDIVFGDGDDS